MGKIYSLIRVIGKTLFRHPQDILGIRLWYPPPTRNTTKEEIRKLHLERIRSRILYGVSIQGEVGK